MTYLHYPKAILFDWDNTLVDSCPTSFYAINTVYKHYNLPPVSMEHIKAQPARSARESFPEIFGEDWEEAAAIYYEAYRDVHLDLITPMPYAQELLDALSQKNIFIGVVSNKLGDNLRTEIHHLGWNKFFKNVVGSRDTPHDKPSPATVQHVLAKTLMNTGKDVWFIGDSEVDMRTACNAQITGILVHPEDKLAEIQKTCPGTIGINNLSEIILFFKTNPTISQT